MTQKVLVYGTLKRGERNHSALETAKFMGVKYTLPTFSLYDAGGFPYALYEGGSTLEVEMYEVDDKTFHRLDVLEGVAYDHYRRVEVEWWDHNGGQGWAWIYVATHSTADFVRDYYTRINAIERRDVYVSIWKNVKTPF